MNEKAIELLQILLEETDKRSGALIANFTEDVDLEAIVNAMFYWEVRGVAIIMNEYMK